MVNTSVAQKCNSGYATKTSERHRYNFHFPMKDEELNKSWINFVHRKGWVPTTNSVLCFILMKIYKKQSWTMGDESYIDTSCQRGLDNSVPPNCLSNM